METVVSGIRSTGKLHLGNYFGAVKNFLKMQDAYNCYFFVADLHSLTTHPRPDDFQANVSRVLIEYLACGLDPEKCALYVQSDIPEIPQLYLLLNMFAYKGELERVVTFKEKAKAQPDNVNAGLLTYPVLQAADIIIHKAHKVPVGQDQKQHLEMTRNFAKRFNSLYGVDYFPEPEAFDFSGELVRIPGLDGSGKMGKSEGEKNAVYLSDEPGIIRKKVMSAVTDSGPTQANQQKSPEIQNLFTLMSVVSSAEVQASFETAYNDCSIRYGDLKKQLADDIVNFTEPIRHRITAISADTDFVSKVRKMGAEKARVTATQTLKDVRSIMGIAPK
jgi:tryptophanyl-tRNA synthetase